MARLSLEGALDKDGTGSLLISCLPGAVRVPDNGELPFGFALGFSHK